jgi:solute carrier family 35 protein E3
VNDVQFNFAGSLVAVLAVITTVVYQTQTNTLQKTYDVNGVQLNQAVALARFVIAIVAAFVIETHGPKNIFNHTFHTVEVAMILSTGCLAVMGNTVGFSLIGRAGPITFQVVGHVKTITVFVFGLLMFPTPEDPPEKKIKKIVGLCVSMLGVVLYTVFEIRNKPKDAKLKKAEEDQLDLKEPGVKFETDEKGQK